MRVKAKDLVLGIYLIMLVFICTGASWLIVTELHQILHDTYPPKEDGDGTAMEP